MTNKDPVATALEAVRASRPVRTPIHTPSTAFERGKITNDPSELRSLISFLEAKGANGAVGVLKLRLREIGEPTREIRLPDPNDWDGGINVVGSLAKHAADGTIASPVSMGFHDPSRSGETERVNPPRFDAGMSGNNSGAMVPLTDEECARHLAEAQDNPERMQPTLSLLRFRGREDYLKSHGYE